MPEAEPSTAVIHCKNCGEEITVDMYGDWVHTVNARSECDKFDWLIV